MRIRNWIEMTRKVYRLSGAHCQWLLVISTWLACMLLIGIFTHKTGMHVRMICCAMVEFHPYWYKGHFRTSMMSISVFLCVTIATYSTVENGVYVAKAMNELWYIICAEPLACLTIEPHPAVFPHFVSWNIRPAFPTSSFQYPLSYLSI